MLITSSRSPAANLNLLVLDSDQSSCWRLAHALRISGYCVQTAASSSEALNLLSQKKYDILIFECNLSENNGEALMQQARQLWPELLFVILTAFPSLKSAISAIRFRAVDYLVKPMSVDKIVVSIEHTIEKFITPLHKKQLAKQYVEYASKLLDHSESSPDSEVAAQENLNSDILDAYPLRLNRYNKMVTHATYPLKNVQLTDGEMAILDCLMTNTGQILSCRQIVKKTWGYKLEKHEAESMIRPHICRLRKKLEGNLELPRLIHTARGLGYYFTQSETNSHSASN